MSIKRWLGQAAAVTDLWTVTLSGTVTSQTYTFTMNGKSIAYTATGGDTVATILAALVALWNLSTNPPEFLELTATGLPIGGPFTSMTMAQDTIGRPSTITVGTSGAATFTISNTTPATGPNFFDNGQNGSGGVAPVNSDTLVFDNGSVQCCYNINSSLTGVTLNINPAFSGTIGLPFINATGQSSYNEYRTTNLTFAGGTAVINSPTIQQCNLAFGANTSTVRVLSTGQRLDPNTPVVLIIGGNGSSELDISKGDVGLAFYQGQSATFPTIKTGYVSQPLTDVSLVCGTGCTLTTISKNGGNAKLSANATTVTQELSGGTLTITDSVAITTLSVYAGTVNYGTVGTIGTVNLYGSATLNCDVDPRGKSVSNPINVFATGVTVIDNQKSMNSGTLSLATNGCPTVNIQHGGNTTIVLT